MREYGWDTIDKNDSGASSARFLSLSDGETVRLRVLDDRPLSFQFHPVSVPDPTTPGGRIYRSVPATANPDDNEIMRATNRFPAKRRFAIRVAVLNDEGDVESLKILEGGKQIFEPMKKLVMANGDINSYDLLVSREGEFRETKYTVQASPRSFEVDVESLVDELHGNQDLDFDVAYPEVTGEQQLQMLAEANIDITVDHVAQLAESMDPQIAASTRMPFGKYEGKTVGDVAKIDTGYVIWASENLTTNDEVAAACMAVLENLKALDKGSAAPRALPEKSKSEDPAPESGGESDGAPDTKDDLPEWPLSMDPEAYIARWDGKGGKHLDLAHKLVNAQNGASSAPEVPEPPKSKPEKQQPAGAKATGDSNELQATVTQMLRERFSSALDVVKAIKEVSDGNATRVSALTDEQLNTLLNNLVEA